MNNVLNGEYPKNILDRRFLNAAEATITCEDGYHLEGDICVPDLISPPAETGICTYPSGTPCDVAFTYEPNPAPCTSYNGATGMPRYRNVGEVALITTALAGIGSAVGSIFGAKAAAQQAENAESQAEYERLLEAEKRTTILYVIIGVAGLLALSIGAYTVVRYIKKRK